MFIIATIFGLVLTGTALFYYLMAASSMEQMKSYCLPHMKSSLPNPVPASMQDTVAQVQKDLRFILAENGDKYSYSFHERTVLEFPSNYSDISVQLDVFFVHVFSIRYTTNEMFVNFSFIEVRFMAFDLHTLQNATAYQFSPVRDGMSVNPPYPYGTVCIT